MVGDLASQWAAGDGVQQTAFSPGGTHCPLIPCIERAGGDSPGSHFPVVFPGHIYFNRVVTVVPIRVYHFFKNNSP